MSHFEPHITYHLHIFSQSMPSFKGFFDTRNAALDYFKNYLIEHFPLAELEIACPHFIDNLLENSAVITKIDKNICKFYRLMFKTGTRRRVNKFYHMIVREGNDE